jgi:hypothetical protein
VFLPDRRVAVVRNWCFGNELAVGCSRYDGIQSYHLAAAKSNGRMGEFGPAALLRTWRGDIEFMNRARSGVTEAGDVGYQERFHEPATQCGAIDPLQGRDY